MHQLQQIYLASYQIQADLFVLVTFLQNILSKHKINNLNKEYDTDGKHGATPELGRDDCVWVRQEHIGQRPSQSNPHTTKDDHKAPI